MRGTKCIKLLNLQKVTHKRRLITSYITSFEFEYNFMTCFFITFNHSFTVSIRNDVTGFSNACSVFLCPQAQCKEIRKKKELVLQILTEPIRNWEGDDIRNLGPVLHMSQAAVRSQNCQVLITTCKQLNYTQNLLLSF